MKSYRDIAVEISDMLLGADRRRAIQLIADADAEGNRQPIKSAEPYQKQAMKTSASSRGALLRLLERMDDGETIVKLMNLLHVVVGLAGELGEIASVVEKVVWYGREYGQDKIDNLKEEAGDCQWYLAKLHEDVLGYDMEECRQANIRKLKERYPDKFDSERSKEENRDRQAEMDRLLQQPGRSTSVTQPVQSRDADPRSWSEAEQTGQGWAEPPEDE